MRHADDTTIKTLLYTFATGNRKMPTTYEQSRSNSKASSSYFPQERRDHQIRPTVKETWSSLKKQRSHEPAAQRSCASRASDLDTRPGIVPTRGKTDQRSHRRTENYSRVDFTESHRRDLLYRKRELEKSSAETSLRLSSCDICDSVRRWERHTRQTVPTPTTWPTSRRRPI